MSIKKDLVLLQKKSILNFFNMFKFEDCLVTVYMRDPDKDPDGYKEDQRTLQNWLSEDPSFRKEAIINYLDHVTDIERAHKEKIYC